MSLSDTNRELIERTKKGTKDACEALVRTFDAVPDDKLTWTAGGEARSPVWMVAHTGFANQAFATLLRGEALDLPSDPAAAGEAIRDSGRNVTSRAEAIDILRRHTDEVLAALDALDDQKMTSTVHSPFGPTPLPFWIPIAEQHMGVHKAQIDYMQTAWGDLQEH